ncbi:HEPN domain-containing protein [Caldanaerovirga acetigignens]|uniref:HEPN domain-containing protein n=1 Tax=Caldanaerovirga acetigignens TaxID=447595 RepID=A0A1M7L4D8_9FIRM|nr:HEPN domain-containing protein [Caldanaerovirga acetigignens]SHM72720.1 HEPN domain-containing protein [Caldanaerovirga acetigignens]
MAGSLLFLDMIDDALILFDREGFFTRFLQEFSSKLKKMGAKKEVADKVDELASISKWLRKEIEFSFYGDVDFIPTQEYTMEDAEKAYNDLQTVIEAAEKVILQKSV